MMTMDADYTFELNFIKTCAPQFKWLNKSFLGGVTHPIPSHKRRPVVKYEEGRKIDLWFEFPAFFWTLM